VCPDLLNVIQDYDRAFGAANIILQFKSQVKKINDIKCTDGICPCAGLRRLLIQTNFCHLEVTTIQTGNTFQLPNEYNVKVLSINSCLSNNIESCDGDSETIVLEPKSIALPIYAIIIITIVLSVLLVTSIYCWYLWSGSSIAKGEKPEAVGDFVIPLCSQ
jgi:hypothetical protein